MTAYGSAADVPSVINVSGTMTALGASIAGSDVAAAMVEILPRFVAMSDLHATASRAIADATGAEAGFVTASASAGITLAVAAAMTGADLARVEQLPDTAGMRDRVVLQAGHDCNYGAPLTQAARLAGAKVDLAGTATLVSEHSVRGALSERTAAGLFVVSHHVVDYGQLPLARFCAMCHEHDVPVIVDAASEYDLRGFLAAGADVVVYSAHKFLGGPTAGIVAGRRELVRACYLQNSGIGRGMKVGKESIAGTIAALAAWANRDAAAIRAREGEALRTWSRALSGVRGVLAGVVPDPTGNPLDRMLVTVDPAQAGASALDVAAALAAGEPAVIVRDHEVDRGWFQLDPCNLHDGEAAVVAERLENVFAEAARGQLPLIDPDAWRRRQETAHLRWAAD